MLLLTPFTKKPQQTGCKAKKVLFQVAEGSQGITQLLIKVGSCRNEGKRLQLHLFILKTELWFVCLFFPSAGEK